MERVKTQNKRRCEDVLGNAMCDRVVKLRKEGFSIWRIAVYTGLSEYYVRKVLRERGVKTKRKGV